MGTLPILLTAGMIGLGVAGCTNQNQEQSLPHEKLRLTGIVRSIDVILPLGGEVRNCGPNARLYISIGVSKNMDPRNDVLDYTFSDTIPINLSNYACDFPLNYPIREGDRVNFTLTGGFERITGAQRMTPPTTPPRYFMTMGTTQSGRINYYTKRR